jgi:uncharacterized protein
VRAYVGDLLAGRETVRTVVFSERLGALVDETSATGPVRGELVLSRVGPTIRVDGRVATRVALVCGACLSSYEQPLEVTIEEEFAAAGGARTPSGQPLSPEAFVMPLEAGEVIDLTEVVRQHLVLALPIAPRCSPDCRGLCPVCGADLNGGACGCDVRGVDPRMRALEGWGNAAAAPRRPARGSRADS